MAVALTGTLDVGRRLAEKCAEVAHRIRCLHVFEALCLDDALAIVNRAGIGRKRHG